MAGGELVVIRSDLRHGEFFRQLGDLMDDAERRLSLNHGAIDDLNMSGAGRYGGGEWAGIQSAAGLPHRRQ